MSAKIGAFFPTQDMPADPQRIREWTIAAEEIGFDYIEVSDHVYLVPIEKHVNFDGPYDVDDCFSMRPSVHSPLWPALPIMWVLSVAF